MQLIVNRLKGERNRSSTRANYYGIWKQFNEFFIRLDTKPQTWEERLVLFVGFLIDQNKKSNTIKSYISAIKSVLKDDGEDLNEDVYLLKSLTNACRLKNDHVSNRLPIRKNLLQLMVAEVGNLFETPQPYLTLLYQTIFTTAYFGLFRIGEVTKSQHVVLAKDVHIGKNKNKLMFLLHSSKTHWFDSKPQVVKISSSEIGTKREDAVKNDRNKYENEHIKTFCPFQMLKDFVTVRGQRKRDDEQFFIFKDGSPVLPGQARYILKSAILKLGLDARLYEFKSLRGGRATDLAAMKIDLGLIKTLGRWRSNAVFKYLKT